MKTGTCRALAVSLLMALPAVCLADSEPGGACDAPPELGAISSRIQSVFNDMDAALAQGVGAVASAGVDEPAVRGVLKGYAGRFPYLMDCGFITAEGILRYIEPEAYRSSEGFDISRQAHIIRMRETQRPVLSESFFAVEGFWSVTYAHPVLRDGAFLGSLFLLVKPDVFLREIIGPHEGCAGEAWWVMEKGGRIMYDADPQEIGRNLFDDPLYAPFGELLAAGRIIDAEQEGRTTYQFYDTGTNRQVRREAFWTTINVNGTEWKLVLIRTI